MVSLAPQQDLSLNIHSVIVIFDVFKRFITEDQPLLCAMLALYPSVVAENQHLPVASIQSKMMRTFLPLSHAIPSPAEHPTLISLRCENLGSLCLA